MDYTIEQAMAIEARVSKILAERMAKAVENAENAFAWMVNRCVGEHEGICPAQMNSARLAARRAAWLELKPGLTQGAYLAVHEANEISKKIAAQYA